MPQDQGNNVSSSGNPSSAAPSSSNNVPPSAPTALAENPFRAGESGPSFWGEGSSRASENNLNPSQGSSGSRTPGFF